MVGKNIKEYRIMYGFSQKQLGEMLGYSARTISDWEKGNTEPNITSIKNLIKIFNISYEDLLD